MTTVALGVVLGLVGSISINTGNNLQSLGMHQLEDSAKYYEDIKPTSSRTWVWGTVIFVVGALLNFASYGFAPQSTLASLESIQFVTNLFFSKVLLKKRISRSMYAGTLLTVGGTILAVMFSSKEAAVNEVIDDLISLWDNYLWIGYICVIAILAVILQVLYSTLELRGTESAGITNVKAVIYATFSALWGTLSVVFAKLLALLLEFQASDGVSIFAHWFTWITLLSWMVLMIYWLYRLNAALGLYDPLFIIPLLQANFIFFAIVSGGIYFQEFNYMKSEQWVGFSCGVVCMFFGIFLLVPPKEEDFQLDIPIAVQKEISSAPGGFLSPRKPTMRRMSVMVMNGAGRMNQRAFDVKGHQKRFKKLKEKRHLSDDETMLALYLESVISGVKKLQKKKSKLQKIRRKKRKTPFDIKELRDLQKTISHFEETLEKADAVIQDKERRISRAQEVGEGNDSQIYDVVLETARAQLPHNWSFRTVRASFLSDFEDFRSPDRSRSLFRLTGEPTGDRLTVTPQHYGNEKWRSSAFSSSRRSPSGSSCGSHKSLSFGTVVPPDVGKSETSIINLCETSIINLSNVSNPINLCETSTINLSNISKTKTSYASDITHEQLDQPKSLAIIFTNKAKSSTSYSL